MLEVVALEDVVALVSVMLLVDVSDNFSGEDVADSLLSDVKVDGVS